MQEKLMWKKKFHLTLSLDMDFGGNHSNGGSASTTLNRDDAKDVLFNMKHPQRLTKLCANRIRHTADDESSFNSSYSTDSFFIPYHDDYSLVINRNLKNAHAEKGDEKRLPQAQENSLEKENTIIRFKLSNVSSSSSEPTPSINI